MKMKMKCHYKTSKCDRPGKSMFHWCASNGGRQKEEEENIEIDWKFK